MKKIELTQGLYALVDDKDYDWLNSWKWHASGSEKQFYACRTENKKLIQMHREILRCSDDEFVDHKDGNGLNNQRENIRKCTRHENNRNKSIQKNSETGYKGVSKSGKKYRARIMVNGKWMCLKSHLTAKDAAIAFDEAAKKHFGEFAKLNFPNTK